MLTTQQKEKLEFVTNTSLQASNKQNSNEYSGNKNDNKHIANNDTHENWKSPTSTTPYSSNMLPPNELTFTSPKHTAITNIIYETDEKNTPSVNESNNNNDSNNIATNDACQKL